MKEPYEEGVANHFDLQSCAESRETESEALAEVGASWVLSFERLIEPGADAVLVSGRQHRRQRHRELPSNRAESETPRAHRTFLHENREIL